MQDETVIRPNRATAAAVETTSVARIELDNGISFSIEKANLPVRIGRSADCDICIPSGLVSRHHCELFLANGVLCLKDTSSNGTVIDDRVIRQGSVPILGPASVLFAGEVSIRIIPGTAGAAANRPPGNERRERGPDRRQQDRRQRVVVVNFERRCAERRLGERRT